ncbi:MAG TPA: short chain dehydrogenase [Actinoplanes sp.]|jgi:NAD(P)-dependent dehydrogenase (short-subunit alcohol dehydrogenase family)
MRVIVVGTGTIGTAVAEVLRESRHEVVTVSRTAGDFRADVTDRASLEALFGRIGEFDAVASAAGDVFPAPLASSTDEQWAQSLGSKGMGQIDLVRGALPHIADGGSFTLVSGVLGDEVNPAMTIGATVNGMVEGFVRAAATELPRGIRINCVSPTVLTESRAFHPYFPGFVPVPARDVALAYLRAISNPYNGRILRLHRVS